MIQAWLFWRERETKTKFLFFYFLFFFYFVLFFFCFIQFAISNWWLFYKRKWIFFKFDRLEFIWYMITATIKYLNPIYMYIWCATFSVLSYVYSGFNVHISSILHFGVQFVRAIYSNIYYTYTYDIWYDKYLFFMVP